MLPISVEISTTCRGCQSPVALNAVVPRVACDRCGRAIELGAHTWRAALGAAIEQGLGAERGREKTTALTTEIGTIQIIVRTATPECAQCKAPVPLEKALENGAQSWAHACGQCGLRVAARPVPAEIAVAAELLFDEEVAMLWPQQRQEAVVLRCAACGSPVSVDAQTARITPCTHCRAQVYVPDDLWALLHPVRAVRPFVIGAKGEARVAGKKKGGKKRALHWSTAHDLVIDREGRIYLAITREDDKSEIVALAKDGQEIVWRKELPTRYAEEPRLAFAPSGHVCVRAADKRSMLAVRALDGATEAELGADPKGEAPDAKFDLRKCESLACDADGSIVASMTYDGGHRLVRFDPRGARIPLFPGIAADARPSASSGDDDSPPMLEDSRDQPVALQCAILGSGLDGLLWISGSQAIASYDRNGTRRFFLAAGELLADTGGPSMGKVMTDAVGHAWSWSSDTLVRVDLASRKVETWLTTLGGSLLRNENVVAVGPDGSVVAIGPEGAMRMFDAQRRLTWASDRARTDDREAVERDDDDSGEEEDLGDE